MNRSSTAILSFRTALLCVFLVLPSLASRESPNLAKVETATFIGGAGTEWFTGAAFPGDESILVVGVSLDPELTIHGVTAVVLGKDAPPVPAPTGYRKLGGRGTGKIAVPDVTKDASGLDLLGDEGGLGLSLDEPKSKKQIEAEQKKKAAKLASVPGRYQFYIPKTVEVKDAYARLVGNEPSATGFIGRFDPTLKQVKALYRLPRGAGSISSVVVGKQGAIYITGGATDRIANLCADRREDKIPGVDPAENAYPHGHVFLAKLSADLSTVLWQREIKAHSYAPVLTAMRNGNVAMLGPGYLQYDPDGKLLVATAVQRTRVVSGSAVCPVTGRYTRVGDWMSGTGREPYRCPRLVVSNPDGSCYKWLLGWRGPFFCPNHFHIVADSAVRRSAYDEEGNMVYSTWSHGGNNCCGRYPYDAERHWPDSMRYTGSQTYAYIIKLDPEHNFKVGMLFTSAGNVQTLGFACDGSIVWTGHGNTGTALPNRLSKSESGMRLIVTEPNLATYRFNSIMPACGARVAVGGCNDKINEWAFASGKCGGKPLLLCLTGAMAKEKTLEGEEEPPLADPVQAAYGGGLMDGYALLMDLTPKQPLAFELPPQEKRPPRPFKPYDGPRRLWPTEGQVWKIGTESCITVTVTFRDEHEKMWPSFFQGKGVAGGTFTYGTNSAAANFTLDCPTILQDQGLQHQRVLGELVTATTTPKLKMHFTGSSPWEETGKMYDLQKFPVGTCKLSGTLELDDKTVPFKDAVCEASFSYPYRQTDVKFAAPNYSLPKVNFTVAGKDLGLKPPLADQQIKVRVAWEAVSPVKGVKDKSAAPPKAGTGELDLGGLGAD